LQGRILGQVQRRWSCESFGEGKLTHAEITPSSTLGPTVLTCSCSSSSAFAFVVLSFFPKFRNETTTFGSERVLRSGCSAMYDREDPVEGPPKPNEGEPNAAVAARALDACDLNFLLIASLYFGRVACVGRSSFGRRCRPLWWGSPRQVANKNVVMIGE
jgi:hypothetical protein